MFFKLPFADFLELAGIIHQDLYTKLHTRLLKVDVQTSDLCTDDAFFHSYDQPLASIV